MTVLTVRACYLAKFPQLAIGRDLTAPVSNLQI